MKPYGRDKNLKSTGNWKVDNHARPKRIWKNWWEDMVSPLKRGAINHNVKKEIENEINN